MLWGGRPARLVSRDSSGDRIGRECGRDARSHNAVCREEAARLGLAPGMAAGGRSARTNADRTMVIREKIAVDEIGKLAQMLATDELTTTKLVDGTGVILDVDSLRVFTLNETGMFLVEEIAAGVADRDGLTARLVTDFEVDETAAAADVEVFVRDLAAFLLAG